MKSNNEKSVDVIDVPSPYQKDLSLSVETFPTVPIKFTFFTLFLHIFKKIKKKLHEWRERMNIIFERRKFI